MYKKLSAPVSLQIEITEACNNNCLHCYNHWRTSKCGRHLSSDDVYGIVKQLKENKVFDVTITGGEPLIVVDEVVALASSLSAEHINFSLNTNLRLFDRKIALLLKSCGVNNILTSLLSSNPQMHDSIASSRNAFVETVRGIETAIEFGFNLGVNMVLTRLNRQDLYETALFVKQLGVKNFCATKFSPPIDNREVRDLFVSKSEVEYDLDLLVKIENELSLNVDILECYPLCLMKNGQKYKKFIRRNCGAGVNSCTIGADGGLRPCSHSNITYGNVFIDGLNKSWDNMNQWRDGSLIPEVCKKCKFFTKCTGGCRMDACYHSSLDGLDPYATPENISLIVEAEPKAYSEGTKYAFLPFRSRSENESQHFIFTGATNFLVNKEGYATINLWEGKTFRLCEVPEEDKVFLTTLVQIGFAKEV